MKAKIEIIFVVFFISLIFLPYLFAHRTKEERVSDMENRMLSEYPSLFVDNSININYLSEFEDWLQDNLRGRTLFVEFYSTMQYQFFERIVKDNVIQGKNGWLFSRDEILEYQHLNLLEQDELDLYVQNMQKLSDYLKKKEIAFYYMQCYDKAIVYPEEYAEGIQQVGDISRADQIISALQDKTDIRLIPIKETLQRMVNQEIYYKYVDLTHWNERGAYWGYHCLMEEIKKDFPQVQVLEENDYEIEEVLGDTYLYGFRYPLTESFPVYKKKVENAEEITERTMNRWDFLHYKEHTHDYENISSQNDLKILLVGDSFIRQFIKDDIAESFSCTLSIDWMNIMILDEVVEEYKPDIVVLECAQFPLDAVIPLIEGMDFVE